MINLFSEILSNTKNEEIIEIFNKESIRVERIVSTGQTTPKGFWYDQDEHEFVVLLEGDAIIEFETHEVTLKKGDVLNIEKHQRHRVKYTSLDTPTIWLVIFY